MIFASWPYRHGHGDDSLCRCIDLGFPFSQPHRARAQACRSSASADRSAPTTPRPTSAFIPGPAPRGPYPEPGRDCERICCPGTPSADRGAPRSAQIKVDASTITDPAKFKEYQDAQNALTGALGRLLVTVERYPDLKSNSVNTEFAVGLRPAGRHFIIGDSPREFP